MNRASDYEFTPDSVFDTESRVVGDVLFLGGRKYRVPPHDTLQIKNATTVFIDGARFPLTDPLDDEDEGVMDERTFTFTSPRAPTRVEFLGSIGVSMNVRLGEAYSIVVRCRTARTERELFEEGGARVCLEDARGKGSIELTLTEGVRHLKIQGFDQVSVQDVKLSLLSAEWVRSLRLENVSASTLGTVGCGFFASKTCELRAIQVNGRGSRDPINVTTFAKMDEVSVHVHTGVIVISFNERSGTLRATDVSVATGDVRVKDAGNDCRIEAKYGKIFAHSPGKNAVLTTESGSVKVIHPGPGCEITATSGTLTGKGKEPVVFYGIRSHSSYLIL